MPEAAVRSALDRLGSPEAIVAAARPDGERRRGTPVLEVAALLCITLGSFVIPFVAWLVGAVLLWMSGRWSLRDKLLGTLIWPGGLGGLLILAGLAAPWSGRSCGTVYSANGSVAPSTCHSFGSAPPLGLTVLVVTLLLGAPILMVVHLARRLQRG